MNTFFDYEDFHDFTLERFELDCMKKQLCLRLISESRERKELVFRDIVELQVVDLAMDSVIDEIKEILPGELKEYGDFESRYKWSIFETMQKFGPRYRLWIIGSSFGMQAAIYAGDCEVCPAV